MQRCGQDAAALEYCDSVLILWGRETILDFDPGQ
jgi:hypothetical protein